MSDRRFATSFLVPFLFHLIVTGASAQTVTGRISGTVTDQTGAILPGVTITATEIETRRQHITTTNGDGRYVLYPLPPGAYDIQAKLDGFRAQDIRNLRVSVADVIVRNLVLTVGSREEVSVVGSASELRQGVSVDSPTARQLQPFWGSPTRAGLANNAVRFARNEEDAHQFAAGSRAAAGRQPGRSLYRFAGRRGIASSATGA